MTAVEYNTSFEPWAFSTSERVSTRTSSIWSSIVRCEYDIRVFIHTVILQCCQYLSYSSIYSCKSKKTHKYSSTLNWWTVWPERYISITHQAMATNVTSRFSVNWIQNNLSTFLTISGSYSGYDCSQPRSNMFGVSPLPALWPLNLDCALFWYLFCWWTVQVLCFVTAQGGGRCWQSHTAKGCCTATNMALTSIKRNVFSPYLDEILASCASCRGG